MARYRTDLDNERENYPREDRLRRENFGGRGYDEPWGAGRRYDNERQTDYNRGGRFGERAEYDYDEPRYANYSERENESRRSSLYEGRGDLGTGRWRDREYTGERSRLRCRDIMTRELVVATRDTTVVEVSRMMKQEDVGVIPVVEYDTPAGNGRTEGSERNYQDRNYARGKLIGLITDRDIVVRCVADNKDCD